MLLRRVTASFLAFFMLHLTIAAADVACARHEGGMGRATAGGAMAMPHDAPSAPAATATHDSAPCEIPTTTTNCCSALASCSIAFAAPRIGSDPQPRDRDVMAALRGVPPRALIVAPDPPPPKA